MYNSNSNNKARVFILTSNKINFKTKYISRNNNAEDVKGILTEQMFEIHEAPVWWQASMCALLKKESRLLQPFYLSQRFFNQPRVLVSYIGPGN